MVMTHGVFMPFKGQETSAPPPEIFKDGAFLLKVHWDRVTSGFLVVCLCYLGLHNALAINY